MSAFKKAGSVILKILRKTGYYFLLFIFFFLLIASIPYALSSVYDFPPPRPFKGSKIYNPYADTTGIWLKANFQAHSGAWGGLTDGKIPVDELYQIYKDMGYDVVGITNYQQITMSPVPDESYIPMYEHGYNVWKRHHLVIGAEEVVWSDFLIFQTLHHKQDMLKTIAPTTEIIAISHPKFMDGFIPSDFKYLTDYDYLEVLNHYRLSLVHWDSALSAGKIAWGMGDDDSHDQHNLDETGRYWNMVFSKSRHARDIISALKRGSIYCVGGYEGKNDNALESLKSDTASIFIDLEEPAVEIRFIGQGGDTLKKAYDTDTSTYSITPEDTYIRIEAVTPTTTMYFNPLYRYEGTPLLKQSAVVNTLHTWIYRILFFASYIALFVIIFKVRKYRRKKREEKENEPEETPELQRGIRKPEVINTRKEEPDENDDDTDKPDDKRGGFFHREL